MKFMNRVTLQLSALVAISVLAACAPNASTIEMEAAPNTGDPTLEELGVSALTAGETKPGLQVYVIGQHVYGRTSPEVRVDNVAGAFDLNDKLEVISSERIGPNEFVAVKVVESKTVISGDQTLYISAKFIDKNPKKDDPAAAEASKYFIVTNIATEKVRVYRKCEDGEGCVNKMIFEQDVVNGEDEDGTRTDVGHFRISSWEKFYETPGKYPAWYRAGYPSVPNPGDRTAWFDSRVMPGGRGEMRGAFGWYTAKVAPNPRGQWIHGTAGWGKDKKDFILFKNSFWGGLLNLFTSIRSHGCTRIDNESIAYLRSLLPLGTTYVKIYAKEGTRTQELREYSKDKPRWEYIITKNDAGKTNSHQLAARDVVLSQGTPRSEWIEEGTLEIDQYPNAVAFDKSAGGSRGGDLYGLGGRSFRGVFLVDEGTVVDYQHPNGLYVGGYPDRQLPAVMMTANRSYFTPKVEKSESGHVSVGRGDDHR